MKHLYFLLIVALSCHSPTRESRKGARPEPGPLNETSIVVLGNVQDGGSPHVGCKKDCCRELFLQPDLSRQVTCLGLIDPVTQGKYMFEASPDFSRQAKELKQYSSDSSELPNGIFLTHAHIGHYTGLMYLGREAANAMRVPVFAMPRMKAYLENNGPWSQLVLLGNIALQPLVVDSAIFLGRTITVIPLKVPHRDEYSETAGFIISGPHKKVLFISDIDKWEKWDMDIVSVVNQVDYAFIDATFYDGREIGHRNISEIPHPFVIETMKLFEAQPAEVRNKIYFIHLNHTNPLLRLGSEETRKVESAGFHVARKGMVLGL